jgi:hypothetical protein
MSRLRFIEIDGRRYLWRDILRMRAEQKQARAVAQQAVLFELKLDCRPASEQTAAGRYREPSLFNAESQS